MRLLQISAVLGLRITGRICTALADALIENASDYMIAYGREQVPKRYRDLSVCIVSDAGAYVHGLCSGVPDNTGFASKGTTSRFFSWVKAYDSDIIHLHDLHGYDVNIEVLSTYLREENKRVVWTFHDWCSFKSRFVYFDYAECKWKDGCFHCPEKHGYPASYMLDNSKHNHERKKQLLTSLKELTIVTPSKWLAKFAKQSYLAKYPVRFVHNGIYLEQCKPTPLNLRDRHHIADQAILLGVVSFWSRRKGIDTFFKLARELDSSYVVALVGLSQRQLKNSPKNISGIQRTNSAKELAEMYSVSDVFINSTLEGNCPTVNLETTACGTPVVTYDTGGSPETVFENSRSVVVAGDMRNLVCEISFLCASRQRNRTEPVTLRDLSNKQFATKYLELFGVAIWCKSHIVA